MPARIDPQAAVRALAEGDPALGALIARVGPCTLAPAGLKSPFEALAKAIVYQQLSGKAAGTIFGRVVAAVGDPLTPEALLATSDETLRGAGLSRAKLAAVKDLAVKTQGGLVPDFAELETLEDAAIVERLTAVRGIGRWTVEMLLIFDLGRPDVLPVHDLGVRKGAQRTYGLSELPTPRVLEAFGERWRPHRSVASWYMWRATELP